MTATMYRDLNDVQTFATVVGKGSFTAAAKFLELPTSTVSRRVSRLEAHLGVRLLQRTTRKLSLTDAGRLYYERGVRVLAELEDAESLLSQARATPSGRVRAVAPIEHSIAMRLVNEFLVVCPQVRVDISFTNREVNIIEEGYDLSIHAGPITNMSVVAHKLMDSPFSLVASPSYLRRRGKPKSPTDLSNHDCVVFGASSANAHWSLATPEPTEVAIHGRIAADHLHAVVDAAVAGHGIALVPTLTCRREIREGRLKVVLPKVSPPPVALHVTYPAGRYLPAAVRAFVDFVRANFKRAAEEDLTPSSKRSRKSSLRSEQ